MMTATQWRVDAVDVGRYHCEGCGHEIVNRYYLTDDLGHSMIVGSECVKQWCGHSESLNANRLAKRIARAARDWKQTPSTETREKFINRRLTEMNNALEACEEWSRDFTKFGNDRVDELERKHNANRSDFQRPIWTVKKL
jgi:hypothetical protein